LEDRQTAASTSAPARKLAGKAPWRWKDLDLGGRIGVSIGVVLALIVISSLISAIIGGIR
jgi:hypothetical protein